MRHLHRRLPLLSALGVLLAFLWGAAPVHALETLEGEHFTLKVPNGFQARPQKDCGG